MRNRAASYVWTTRYHAFLIADSDVAVHSKFFLCFDVHANYWKVPCDFLHLTLHEHICKNSLER